MIALKKVKLKQEFTGVKINPYWISSWDGEKRAAFQSLVHEIFHSLSSKTPPYKTAHDMVLEEASTEMLSQYYADDVGRQMFGLPFPRDQKLRGWFDITNKDQHDVVTQVWGDKANVQKGNFLQMDSWNSSTFSYRTPIGTFATVIAAVDDLNMEPGTPLDHTEHVLKRALEIKQRRGDERVRLLAGRMLTMLKDRHLTSPPEDEFFNVKNKVMTILEAALADKPRPFETKFQPPSLRWTKEGIIREVLSVIEDAVEDKTERHESEKWA